MEIKMSRLKEPSEARPEISKEIALALGTIVEYLWDDERKHFLANCPYLPDFHGAHVFESLVTVRHWLEGELAPKSAYVSDRPIDRKWFDGDFS